MTTLRSNVSVGVQYLEAWLGGMGCVPLENLMEDAATAEICRTQACPTPPLRVQICIREYHDVFQKLARLSEPESPAEMDSGSTRRNPFNWGKMVQCVPPDTLPLVSCILFKDGT